MHKIFFMDPTQVPSRSGSLDAKASLAEFAGRASKYSFNLNGRVFKDDCYLFRGGYAIVHSGDLQRENVGTVVRGDPNVQRSTKVAIKTPRGGPPGDVDTIKRFLKEVHVWSKLDHPNVLPLLGVTTDFDLTVSIVSPWIKRGNARKYVEDTADDPRPLMAGVAKGLHYLHTHKPSPVFHGDLKGVNILISDTGNALLADFGFSLIVNSSFSMSIHSDGGAKGTVNWMAPEMVSGQNASAEADVWAFGMTVLELFTSKNPFYHLPQIQSVICAIVGERLPNRPDDKQTHSRMTDMWWNICSHCWSYRPSSRPKMAMVVGWIAEEMRGSCSSVPNGTFQVNGSGRRYYPTH